MNNTITTTQQKFLTALLQNFEKTKYAELKRDLRISKKTSVSDLTKSEAYHLITKLIAESDGKDVARALAIALERELA